MTTARMIGAGTMAAAVWLSPACDADKAGSHVRTPGQAETAVTKALDKGAALLQDKPPIEALNAYLDGFHFYGGNMRGQMEAHHYCAIVNEDVTQCVIYDGNVKDARIMGVEYIISERLFKTLPPQEKVWWHSHVHEVKSGQLVAPGLPDAAEKTLMKKLVGTYGKTWHTWHTDMHKTLPLGVPQVMMGFTADGQADEAMVKARDERLRIDSQRKRRERADIVAPPVALGADAWQHGPALQLRDPTGAAHHGPHGIPSGAARPVASPPVRD